MTSQPAGVDGSTVKKSASSYGPRRWGMRGTIALAILWILHTAAQFFAIGVDKTSFMKHKLSLGFMPSTLWRYLLSVHVAAAVVAMAAGCLAMVLAVRNRSRYLHRLSGRVYASAVLVSALSGLPLTFSATGGSSIALGFLLLDCVWLAVTALAYRHAKRRDVLRHRAWAVRSYAVTFANLTLHLLTASLTVLSGSRSVSYTIAVWLCWPVNILVAEWILNAIGRSEASEHVDD